MGRKQSEETKAKLSKASLGKAKSVSHRIKVALAKGAKPFYVYAGDQTEPIAKYISINQAAQELGGFHPTLIQACLQGKLDSTNGYRFVLEESLLESREYPRHLDLDKIDIYYDFLHLAKPMKVNEPDRLVEVIAGKTRYPDEFRALVLRLLDQYPDIKKVAKLCCVPEQTIYVWLLNWNNAQQENKKTL